MTAKSSQSARRCDGRCVRRGGIAFEMILVLVTLLIATIGVVQFGVFLANAQQVALAARVGVLEASQTADLPVTNSPVPLNILAAIEHQLASSGIGWCTIRVEHDIHPTGEPVELLTALDPDCKCEIHEPLASPPPRGYVRITVCVPLSQVMPEQLSFFGSQIYGEHETYEHSAVFRYELDAP
jgi:Flp pilus assembly protein TadG